MNEVKLSPALELLQLAWRGVNDNKAMCSWARLNRCMQNALHLSIEAGLDFGLDDFAYISTKFRWGYWAGDSEDFYSHAVTQNSMSAIKAYEHYRNRQPFIVNGVIQWWRNADIHRNRGRLAVGSKFIWQGERITVTSFDDKDGKVIVCSYKPREHDERGYLIGSLKVGHIYKIAHKDLVKRREASPNGELLSSPQQAEGYPAEEQ